MAIRNKVIVQARLKFLKHAVMDFFKGAYAEHRAVFRNYDRVLQTLERGIDREYLERVDFVGKKGNVVKNVLTIKIDWDKHRVLCTSFDGADVDLSGSKSVAEQVSAVLPLLSKFISDSLKSEVISRVDAQYFAKSCLDAKTREAAYSDLGLIDLPEEERKALQNFYTDNFAVEVVPEKLQELSIRFVSHTAIKFDDEDK